MPNLTLAFALLALVSVAPPPTAEWTWTADLASALEQAKAEQGVVFVALDYEGEGRCEEFLGKLIKDKAVAAMAAATHNVVASDLTHGKGKKCRRFDGLACEDHVRLEADVRAGYLLTNDKDVVAVPQYLWLDGEGKVLLSVPFELDRDGLLWCSATARALANPAAALAMPDEARPPRRLLMGRAYKLFDGDERGRGLTPTELDAVLAGTRSNFLGLADVASILRVISTDEADAVDYVRKTLAFTLDNFAKGRTPETVHALGVFGTHRYWEALAEFAEVEDDTARLEVAVALEQLGAPGALKLVKAALKREKQPALERAWLRALAATGATDKGVRKTLLKSLDDSEPSATRASAAFALGYLVRGEDVQAAWTTLLAGPAGELRLAAACGAALARDASLVSAIEAARDAAEASDREVLERCLAAMAGGDLYPLEDDVAKLTGDSTRRERIFFGSPAAEAPKTDAGGGR